MLALRLPVRCSSSFAALQQLLKDRTHAIATDTLRFQEAFDKYSLEHQARLKLSLNRLLPEQERRVEMVLQELMQLTSLEKRAFFTVFEERRKQEFAGVNGMAALEGNPLMTGESWPFNHPRNIEFQEEMGAKGQLGLHGLPAAFVEKLKSGEAYQSLDSVEVAAAPAEKAEVKKVEEVKEEKTSFNLMLKGFNADAKLKVIKEIKTILSLGLKEAKDKVELTAKEPVLLYKNVSKDSVKAAYDKLAAAGAVMDWQ